jgi:hypothetical protein
MRAQLHSDIVQLESVGRRLGSLDASRLAAYSKADQTTYHYYQGRIYLIQRHLTRVRHIRLTDSSDH